jgi:hypothetical protein
MMNFLRYFLGFKPYVIEHIVQQLKLTKAQNEFNISMEKFIDLNADKIIQLGEEINILEKKIERIKYLEDKIDFLEKRYFNDRQKNI